MLQKMKGYIARGVKIQTHTYGKRKPTEANLQEWYELTQDECTTMAPKLHGKPILHWHNHALPYLDPQPLGTVLASGFDKHSGDWGVTFQLNETGQRVWEAAQRAGQKMCLSLRHNQETLEPSEVSLTITPGRAGASILATNDVRYNDPVFGKFD